MLAQLLAACIKQNVLSLPLRWCPVFQVGGSGCVGQLQRCGAICLCRAARTARAAATVLQGAPQQQRAHPGGRHRQLLPAAHAAAGSRLGAGSTWDTSGGLCPDRPSSRGVTSRPQPAGAFSACGGGTSTCDIPLRVHVAGAAAGSGSPLHQERHTGAVPSASAACGVCWCSQHGGAVQPARPQSPAAQPRGVGNGSGSSCMAAPAVPTCTAGGPACVGFAAGAAGAAGQPQQRMHATAC